MNALPNDVVEDASVARETGGETPARHEEADGDAVAPHEATRAPREGGGETSAPREAGGERPAPLSGSGHLVRLSESAVAFARLYGRGPVCRCIGDAQWRFQWRHLTGGLCGVELHLRLGGVRLAIVLESLTAFGAANDVMRPEIPTGLHAAYLSGIGAALWREVEAITQRAVEVLAVRLDSRLEITPECLGFEIVRDPEGLVTRGAARFIDTDSEGNAQLLRALSEASLREMAAPPLLSQLPLLWTAVVGCTSLPVAEARELEPHDVVLIDDFRPAADALNCRLAVGNARRYVGRVALRNGELYLVQFGTSGGSKMSANSQANTQVNTQANAQATSLQEAGFEEVPVCVRFELTQWNASLAEISKLSSGAVIDIGQRLEDHSISVWIDQRCIGRGQLVVIGERLGVRLNSVFAQ